MSILRFLKLTALIFILGHQIIEVTPQHVSQSSSDHFHKEERTEKTALLIFTYTISSVTFRIMFISIQFVRFSKW